MSKGEELSATASMLRSQYLTVLMRLCIESRGLMQSMTFNNELMTGRAISLIILEISYFMERTQS